MARHGNTRAAPPQAPIQQLDPKTPPPPYDAVNVAWVATACGVTVQTIYRWVEIGLLPPPMVLGPKTRRWDRRTILAHLSSKGMVARAV